MQPPQEKQTRDDLNAHKLPNLQDKIREAAVHVLAVLERILPRDDSLLRNSCLRAFSSGFFGL